MKKEEVNELGLYGIKKSFNKENITLEIEQEEITIERKNISNIKIKFNW